MRNVKNKFSLFIFLLLCSFKANTQNTTIDSLRKVVKTQKEDSGKVNKLNLLSYNLYQTGYYDSAMNYANEALRISEKIKFKEGAAEATIHIGNATSLQNNDSLALEYFYKALKISDDKKNTGRSYFSIGLSYYSLQNWSESLKNLLTSLAVFQTINDDKYIGNCYLWIARVYNSLDNYDESLKYFYNALKSYQAAGYKKGLIDAYQGIGGTYMTLGNAAEAKENYLSCLKLRQEIKDTIGIAQSYNSLGVLSGSNYESLINYLEALKTYVQMGNRSPNWGLPWTYALIGKVYQSQADSAYQAGDKITSQKKLALARENLLLAMEKWKSAGNNLGVAESYVNLGNLYVKLKQFSTARSYLEKALSLSKTILYKKGLSWSYRSLSNLDLKQGKYKRAYGHYELYISYRDSLYNEESKTKLMQSKMQYEFDKKEAVAKAEQDRKDAEANRIKNLQYFAISSLGVVVLVVLLIASIQWRHNKHKQKANMLLQQEKEKVESTLSELKSTQSQLIQSEKMASLGELTAGIAHEIQNPLNFVNNFSEINTELIEEANGEIDKGNMSEVKIILHDIKENEEKINHHGKRADAIVKGMLQHSQTSIGQKQPTNINKLADEYLRLAYHGLRAKDKSFNATLKTYFDESIGNIAVIPKDIGRVVLNLYNNAFYAIDEKKKQNGEGYEATVSVSTKKVGDKILIRIKDNGNGIPQKIVDKIFQPFFTTKPTGQGTGLGLSLSYDIIKAHGGELKVDTREGEGAEFIISLPII